MILELKHKLGSGNERDCWLHPTDPHLCVKTTHKAASKKNQNQNKQDAIYYALLKKRKILNHHIPKVYGWCETNKGPGLLMERMINTDGTPSLLLSETLDQSLINTNTAKQIIDDFCQLFLAQAITISDENISNFMVRFIENNTPILVVVDGLGHRSIDIKSRLRDRIKALSRKKTRETYRHLLDYVDEVKMKEK